MGHLTNLFLSLPWMLLEIIRLWEQKECVCFTARLSSNYPYGGHNPWVNDLSHLDHPYVSWLFFPEPVNLLLFPLDELPIPR